MLKEKILDLKKIAPNAAFFTSINLNDSAQNNDCSSQADTADADETDITCLPETLTSLFDSAAVNLGNDDLPSPCKDIHLQYHQAVRGFCKLGDPAYFNEFSKLGQKKRLIRRKILFRR